MHVAAALIFARTPPPYERLLAHIESRLGLVPRLQRALDFGLVGDFVVLHDLEDLADDFLARRGGQGRARVPPAGALGVAKRAARHPAPAVGRAEVHPPRWAPTPPVAGGIEIEAVPLPPVRAVSMAPTTRGCV
jgi:hypothetical protein